MMTERELVAALARLWSRQQEWQRLEASSTDGPNGGAYCCPLDGHGHLLPGRESQTYKLLALGDRCPWPVRELARLREESGWRRIEMISFYGRAPGGWCERPDGSGVKLSSMDGYGDQDWSAAAPLAEKALAGKPGSERRWAFMQGLLGGRPVHPVARVRQPRQGGTGMRFSDLGERRRVHLRHPGRP